MKVALGLALALLVFDATPTPAPGLPEAFAKLQAGDNEGAGKILQGLTEREPGNAEAWRVLGVVSLRSSKYDTAQTAFGKALAIKPDMPQALYGMAGAAARKGEADKAFEWLGKARATRKLDMTFAQVDPNMESLRKDPRLLALMPAPEEFANPFVEPVRVLREWDGEASGDQFGWIARNIGDVDGDGVPDVVTSAPTSNMRRREGRPHLRLLDEERQAALDRRRRGGRSARHRRRRRGRHDGDRTFPTSSRARPEAGKAYVYSGKDGRVLLTLDRGGEGRQLRPARLGCGRRGP